MSKVHIRTFTFVLMSSLVLFGCSSHESASSDVAGVYKLVSVDGAPVPTHVSHEGVELEILSGELTINTDGTCSSQTAFIPPTGDEINRNASATYERDGSKVTMHWGQAGDTVSTIQGNTLSMDTEGKVFLYTK